MGPAGHQIPTLAFAAFQGTFAIIAVALVSGAIADRAKFSTWTVFTVVWATLVYFPVAHWVFAIDSFGYSGSAQELYAEFGLTAEAITAAILADRAA